MHYYNWLIQPIGFNQSELFLLDDDWILSARSCNSLLEMHYCNTLLQRKDLSLKRRFSLSLWSYSNHYFITREVVVVRIFY